MQLPVIQKVRGLHLELSVFWHNFSYHALDVVHAVFLDGAAVELIEVLAGGAHVDIEHIYVRIGIFFAAEHGVLCRIHAADFGAIALALLRVFAPRAHALDKNDRLRVRTIGRTKQRSARGACRVHETLKLQTRNNVRALRVSELVELRKIDGVKARRCDDCAVFALDDGILLLIINRARRADLGAHAALAVFEHVAVVGVNRRNLRNRLRKGDVNRAPGIEAEVKRVRDLFLRTLFRARAAAGANILVDKAGLAANFHVEIADEAAHLFDLRVGVDVNFFVLRAVDHFGGQNARCAVKRRERLVDLRHFAADGRLLLDDIDLKTGLRDIECRLNARDAAADDKRPLRDRAGAGGKRRVQLHLCNRGSA